MRRRLMSLAFLSLYILLATESFATEVLERHKEREGMGKSLMGLQEGTRGVVGGLFGIGEHTVKFLFYGTRDGLRTIGRQSKKADRSIQKNLW